LTDFHEPMASRWQIHLSGMVVSRRNCRARAILTGSPLRRVAKSDSCQPASFNPAASNRAALSSALFSPLLAVMMLAQLLAGLQP